MYMLRMLGWGWEGGGQSFMHAKSLSSRNVLAEHIVPDRRQKDIVICTEQRHHCLTAIGLHNILTLLW